MGQGLTIQARSDESLQCPKRGDITLEACMACELFICARPRRRGLLVRCRLPANSAYGSELDATGRWLAYRSGTGIR